jgi:hypothetical protein
MRVMLTSPEDARRAPRQVAAVKAALTFVRYLSDGPCAPSNPARISERWGDVSLPGSARDIIPHGQKQRWRAFRRMALQRRRSISCQHSNTTQYALACNAPGSLLR